MSDSPCVCREAGYCPTFGRQMGRRQHEICAGVSGLSERKEAVYRQNWAVQSALAGHDNPAACDYRGPQIGSTPCKSCNNSTVTVPTFACPLHGKAILYATNDEQTIGFIEAAKRGESPETWICHLCKEREAVQPKRLSDQRFELLGVHLNNSAIRFRGRTIMAYRQGWDNARVVLVDGGKLHPLKLSHGLAQEDPRLFVFRGELHVAYTAVRYERTARVAMHMVTDVAYARLVESPTGWLVAEDFCPQYSGRTFWEKNWGFFDQGGELHAVYSISPRHQVLWIDGDRAELVADEPFELPAAVGQARGGASPVLHNGEWYSFYHGVLGETKDRIYTAGLYTFAAEPPFRPSRAMRRPLMLPTLADRPQNMVPHVVYPGGAIHDTDRWTIAYGYYDHQCRAATFDAAEIEQALFPLPTCSDAGLAARALAEGMEVAVVSYGGSGSNLLSRHVERFRRCRTPLWRSTIQHRAKLLVPVPTVCILADPVLAWESMRRRNLWQHNAGKILGTPEQGEIVEAMTAYFEHWTAQATSNSSNPTTSNSSNVLIVKYEALWDHLGEVCDHLGVPADGFPAYEPRAAKEPPDVPPRLAELRERWREMPPVRQPS